MDLNVELIASSVSLVIALLTALFAAWADRKRRRHEAEQAGAQRQHETRLREVQERIDALSAERNARLDYEYEARKNLYGSVAPLLFQLSELGDSANNRIKSLARTARNGDLGPEKRSWLESEGYYFRSTLYRLLAPLAVGELVRRRLTMVDIGLDKGLATQYRLIRQLGITLSDDYRLAGYEPEIPYRPDDSPSGHGDELGNPDDLRRQGVYTGWLEQARDSLIRRDSEDEPPRVMNYGEFEALYVEAANQGRPNAVLRLRFLVHGFHPERHGVLWRVLVTQSYLYRAFTGIRDAQLSGGPLPDRPIRPLSEDELAKLDYRPREKGPASAGSAEVTSVVTVARRYLSDVLPDLVPDEFAAA